MEDREHIRSISVEERSRLIEWLQRPNGALSLRNATFEAVEDGSVWVLTKPWPLPSSGTGDRSAQVELLEHAAAYRAQRSTEMTPPPPARDPAINNREQLTELLAALFFKRGNDVRTWPADEAEAYREFRWAEGAANARRVMFEKNADAILASDLLAELKQVWQADGLMDAANDTTTHYVIDQNHKRHPEERPTLPSAVRIWLRDRADSSRPVGDLDVSDD